MRKKLVDSHMTLREKILETIREAILKGEMKPGEKVAEPELAERFGISRTPIREAFRQLESEGYLSVIPRKGAVVASLSERDIEEFYAIKSILEGYAARMAAEKLNEKELERLENINLRLEKLTQEGDVKTFFRVHNDFHDCFIRAAGNEKLLALINQLMQKFNRLRMASLSLPGRMETSVSEHKKILRAFREKNGALAESLVTQTAAYGGQLLIQSLAQNEGREGEAFILNRVGDI